MPPADLPPMAPHHAASIRNLITEFERDPSVRALLLGGSLAYGFAKPDSDIDVAIVLDPAEFQKRARDGKLHYNKRSLCTYDSYIDGKYMDVEFLRLVATRGSDPARFALKDSRILFSRIDGLEKLLAEIVRYPAEQKPQRIARFISQLLAWRWYYSEAVRQESPYLTGLALQKITLLAAGSFSPPTKCFILTTSGCCESPNRPRTDPPIFRTAQKSSSPIIHGKKSTPTVAK